MVTFPNIKSADWKTAAERLKSVGVFGDEERKFPSGSSARVGMQDLDRELRQAGYGGGPLQLTTVDAPGTGVDLLLYDDHRFSNPADAAAAWRIEYYNRWHKKVEDSVADWIARLNDLRAKIKSWLPSGMTIADGHPVLMHEDLMRTFGVPSTQMPTFDIVHDGQRIMRVQPKGLWIIGANGRVDLTTRNASYIVVDESPPRSGTPSWRYYSSHNKRTPNVLDETNFVSLLN